jgi:ATP-dependent helicase HrpB
MRVRRLGQIVIDQRRLERPQPETVQKALLAQVHERGLACLPWADASARLRARIAFLRAQGEEDWPDLSDLALTGSAEAWLAPLVNGLTSLSQISSSGLDEAIRALVPWSLRRRLDAEAPEAWTAPTGSRCLIDYGALGGPQVEVRVQELFGLSVHPAIAGGKVPLTFCLLSPARRAIQTTCDLPGFWRGSWTEVRKEMRGRYPKHSWPEDPVSAPPATRAKPRGPAAR